MYMEGESLTKWKRDFNSIHVNTYMWNLFRTMEPILQGRNRDADIKNKSVDTVGG